MAAKDLNPISSQDLQQVKTVFTGIFLEALPFILLGVLLSSLLQLFVKSNGCGVLRRKSGDWRPVRFHARHPVSHLRMRDDPGRSQVDAERDARLYRRHLYPQRSILNPIVFASTIMAFRSHPEVTIGRMGLALPSR